MDNPKDHAKIWDRRTLERNVRKGVMTRKDVEKYLKSLPDAAEKVAEVEIDDEDEDEDDAEGGDAEGKNGA
jgi:hypothetical protein